MKLCICLKPESMSSYDRHKAGVGVEGGGGGHGPLGWEAGGGSRDGCGGLEGTLSVSSDTTCARGLPLQVRPSSP